MDLDVRRGTSLRVRARATCTHAELGSGMVLGRRSVATDWSERGWDMPSFRVVCANPLEHSEEIKGLFLAHDVPDFPEFFDRAYPFVVREGGKSWIGFDGDGRVVAHIARFPRRFTLGTQTVVGGLLADLMTAKSHRTVFPGLTLVRQMTAQSQAEGNV